ncbi:MAG: class I SAM-dependent methyltransferase, partial [Chitinophagaceae bacterium]
MSGSNYSGMMAKFYDEIYRNKPYAAEASFIRDQVVKTFGDKKISILELACGSGNHSLQLAGYGYNIVATDLSEESIAIAKKKGIGRKY